MSIKELRELMKLIDQYKLVQFSMKDGDFELSLRSEYRPNDVPTATQVLPVATAPAGYAAATPMPVAPPSAAAAAPTAATPEKKAEDTLVAVKSPMVGTFYRSNGPDKAPFVKVGDTIAKGDTVCIVEAMKLFNEIDSEVTGTIIKVLIDDASPVEYDQVLFMVEPG